jgi:hypothetical protein
MVGQGLGPWSLRRTFAGILGGLLAVALLAGPAFAAPSPSLHVSYEGSGYVQGQVTWNGADVDQASGPSSSLSTSLTNTIHLVYTWLSPSSSPTKTYTVSDARLQMLYFGQALSTRDVIESNPPAATNGTIDMDWAPPSVLHYLIAGSYELTASLLAPNGTTMWTENFYVDSSAPFAVGALIPLILLAVAAYEVYGLLVSGRHDRPKAPSPPKRWTEKKPAKPASADEDAAPAPEEPADAGPAPPEGEP